MKNPGENAKVIQSIADIAVEAWRFQKVFERMVTKLEPCDRNRYDGQYTWFLKKVKSALDEAGLAVINLEGQPYDVGMAVTAINLDDFTRDEPLIIEQMLEPLIMEDARVVKTGTVLLRRLHS